ncbi:perforin 1 [Scomber scombrus]|uniref:Perforin 1 n=1 Tax=Scomber scombrus TaxID=13677 RepID=A0AAV1MUY8_SCOSC
MASSLSLLLLVLCALTVAETQLRVFNLQATNLPSEWLSESDGYVNAYLGTANLGSTSCLQDNAQPLWEEEFFSSAQENDVLELLVYDSDYIYDDCLGGCKINITVGTHKHDCYLERGGILHYEYTLSQSQ